jgi:hypothetical protein
MMNRNPQHGADIVATRRDELSRRLDSVAHRENIPRARRKSRRAVLGGRLARNSCSDAIFADCPSPFVLSEGAAFSAASHQRGSELCVWRLEDALGGSAAGRPGLLSRALPAWGTAWDLETSLRPAVDSGPHARAAQSVAYPLHTAPTGRPLPPTAPAAAMALSVPHPSSATFCDRISRCRIKA